jgi:hypothetical protein
MAGISLDVDGINYWGNPHPDIKDGDCISVRLEKRLSSNLAGEGGGDVYSKMTLYLHSDTLEGLRVFAQGILDQLPKPATELPSDGSYRRGTELQEVK